MHSKPLSLAPSVTGPDLPPPETPLRRRSIQVIAVLALVAGIGYLVWRGGFTLDLDAWWLSIPLLALEAWTFLGLGLFAYSLWDVDSRPAARRVHATDLRLAVLIPTYDEDIEVLLPTVAAALAMELAHDTYVLDDGDREAVAELAAALGARYVARPTHEHAKAGNVNHALGDLDADVIALFDADHVPEPDFFVSTLGYFDDPRIAVVQTPQEFYNPASFEHVDADDEVVWDRQPVHEETLFYRIVQPGKNRWGAAFWCGTNAAVRVEALREIGGVPTETVTEDIHATVRLQRRGWKTVYHNAVLARGLAAADAEQFRLQRHRWATGAMQLLRTDNPLTTPGLTLHQRFAYLATISAWFDSWRTLGFLLLPPLVILTGASPIAAPLIVFGGVFVGVFAIQQLALVVLSRGYHRPFASARFELTRLGSTLNATLALVVARATRFRVTPKGRVGDERRRIPVPTGLKVLAAVTLLAAAWFALTLAGATPVHYGTPGVAIGAFVWLALNGLLLAAAAHWIARAAHATELRAAVRFAFDEPATIDGVPCRVVDCSLGGARVMIDDADQARRLFVRGTARSLDLRLAGGHLPLDVELRSLRPAPEGSTTVGLELTAGQPRARAALATLLFQGSVAPTFATAVEPEPVAVWDRSGALVGQAS